VPLTASGKLNIVASSDLGALGSRDGSPIAYNWVLPGVAPLLLPWLAILGLLTLKTNRCASSWLIWLPLGCALTVAPPSFMPGGTNFFLEVIAALAIGLAAVWLLSNYLRRQHRFVTFLCVLLVLVGFSVLAAAVKQGLSLLAVESLQIGIVLAIGVLASAVALNLAGLICRRHSRPLGLYLWIFVLLAGIWLAIAAPVFVFAMIASSGRIAWSEFFIPVLAVAAGNFATLLQVKPETPPVIPPLPSGL
jgi:hypothetical protein